MDAFEVLAARAVGLEVFLGWVLAVVLQDGVRQRAQYRFGVLPADHFERAEGIADVDDLVADVAEIAAP